MSKPIVMERGVKYRDADKMALIPVKNVATEREALLRKPEWMKIKLPADSSRIQGIKAAMRKNGLHSVCEEASCPNLAECFNHGTATFMILGAICTRRCPFCDVAHGRPVAPDANEPLKLAQTIADMGLRYVVVTSVDRDDLRDGGAQHFADCITAIREKSPNIKIETLVPDFRGRMDIALRIMTECPPDVFNHNIETVPRLYKAMRPGSDYQHSLNLLKMFKEYCPDIPTKCGLMVGIGETESEVIALLDDLKAHDVDYVTIGQYLQPSKEHAPIDRFVTPEEFERYTAHGQKLGFKNIWAAPMVRSSYFADRQYYGEPVPTVRRKADPAKKISVQTIEA